MGLLVVDASAIAAVTFAEDDRLAIARRLAGQLLIAPPLIVFELVNIALKKCWAGLLTPDQAAASFAEPLRHKLTAYDASYLCLSRINGAELVTLDRRLARAASDA